MHKSIKQNINSKISVLHAAGAGESSRDVARLATAAPVHLNIMAGKPEMINFI